LVPTSTTNRKTSLTAVADAVRTAPVVGVDLETTGLDPRRAEIRLIQIATGEKTFVIDCRDRDPQDLQDLVEALAARAVVAHGATF
jgi:ribonuclease D